MLNNIEIVVSLRRGIDGLPLTFFGDTTIMGIQFRVSFIPIQYRKYGDPQWVMTLEETDKPLPPSDRFGLPGGTT